MKYGKESVLVLMFLFLSTNLAHAVKCKGMTDGKTYKSLDDCWVNNKFCHVEKKSKISGSENLSSTQRQSVSGGVFNYRFANKSEERLIVACAGAGAGGGVVLSKPPCGKGLKGIIVESE